MAFEMTHLRFAKNLKSALRVQNESDYYIGSVYPDSRYVTGVSRASTHTLYPLTDAISDFDKGRRTHILYDELVGPKYLELLPGSTYGAKGFNDSWIKMTALKLLEDQCSYDALGEDVNSLREMFLSPASLQGGDDQKLAHYYGLLHKLYQHKPTMKDYSILFRDFQIPEDAAQGVIDTAEAFRGDVQHIHSVEKLYEAGLKAGLSKVMAMQNGLS